MKKIRLWLTTSRQATILGLVVAVANAWASIDWLSFDITKEYPKLVISAVIAIGGAISSINTRKKPKGPINEGPTSTYL